MSFDDDINAGDTFELELVITNDGDDVARNVVVMLPDLWTNEQFNWDVIEGFVDAVASTEAGPNFVFGGTDWDNRSTEYTDVTLGQLGIEDAKDIVDLALYIEGIYDDPDAEIWVMTAENIPAGGSITLVFTMICHTDMVEGRPYDLNIQMAYVDSFGAVGNYVNPVGGVDNQAITIRTEESGTPYQGGDQSILATSGGIALAAVAVILLVLVIVLFSLWYSSRQKPEDMDDDIIPDEDIPEEDDEPFMDDEELPMEEEEPPVEEEVIGDEEPTPEEEETSLEDSLMEEAKEE